MKQFTAHLQCEACWNAAQPGRTPVVVKSPPREQCCYCGRWTSSGIFVRDESARLLCTGLGPIHVDD